MRPPPFQPPTPTSQGLPRLNPPELAPVTGLLEPAGARPRMTDPNHPGLESVGPRPEEVRRPETEQQQRR